MTNVSLQNTSYNELVKMLGQMQETGAVSQVKYGEMANGVVPLTITLPNGVTVNFNAQLPSTDPSEGGGVDAENMQVMSKAIEELADDVSSTPNTSKSGGSALADLYSVLALLYETAQKQRESSRETRAAEHRAVQGSLEGQAETAKTAAQEAYTQAMNSAITQAVTAGISVAAAGVSFGLQCKAMSSPGVKAAKTDLNSANADMKAAKELPKPDPGTKLEMNPDVNQSMLGDVDGPAMKAKTDYTQAQANVTTKTEALEMSKTDMSKAQAQVKTDTSALEAARKGKDPVEIDKCEKNLELSSEKLKVCESDVGTKANELDKAKVDCGNKAMAYSAELDKLTEQQPDNAELAKFAKTEKSVLRQPAIDGCKVKVDRAHVNLDTTYRSAELSSLMTASKGLDMTSQSSMQIGRSTAAFFDAESQHIQGMKESEQKSAEAEQENLKAQIDTTNDLCQQEQELLNFINEMLKQISQAETGAVQAAIRA